MGSPADLYSRCCGVSAAEGKRKERRSKVIDDAPSFGEALATGTIGAEHVDALANVTSKLDDEVRDAVLDREADLLDDASSMSPEEFGRSCRDLVCRLERDHGLERNRRRRRHTFLCRRLNPSTGMIEGRFSLHPELGNPVFGAVDREVAARVADGTQRGEPEFIDRTVDRQRHAAEALGTLVTRARDRSRPVEADVTPIVDASTLVPAELRDGSVCETSEGVALPPESVRRLL